MGLVVHLVNDLQIFITLMHKPGHLSVAEFTGGPGARAKGEEKEEKEKENCEF